MFIESCCTFILRWNLNATKARFQDSSRALSSAQLTYNEGVCSSIVHSALFLNSVPGLFSLVFIKLFKNVEGKFICINSWKEEQDKLGIKMTQWCVGAFLILQRS